VFPTDVRSGHSNDETGKKPGENKRQQFYLYLSICKRTANAWFRRCMEGVPWRLTMSTRLEKLSVSNPPSS